VSQKKKKEEKCDIQDYFLLDTFSLSLFLSETPQAATRRPVETSARLCGAVVTGRYSPLVAVGDAGSGIASATIPAQTCITATVEPA